MFAEVFDDVLYQSFKIVSLMTVYSPSVITDEMELSTSCSKWHGNSTQHSECDESESGKNHNDVDPIPDNRNSNETK
jgi:hypothetical protein